MSGGAESKSRLLSRVENLLLLRGIAIGATVDTHVESLLQVLMEWNQDKMQKHSMRQQRNMPMRNCLRISGMISFPIQR